MAGLFNQNEKINNGVFIISFIFYALSAFVYFKIYFLPTNLSPFIQISGICFFAVFVIFAPILYGLFSRNLNKSQLFAVLTALPFLWMIFAAFQIMKTYNTFYYSFYSMIGTHLFSFVAFLILGILSAKISSSYHENETGVAQLFSKKSGFSKRFLLFFLLLLNIVVFIIGVPVWSRMVL